MRFASRIVNWAATILMAAALLALTALGVAILMGLKPAVVKTGSMRPNYPPGSLILVKPTPAEKLKLGNVITFTDPDDPKRGLVTHRIVKIERVDGRPIFTTQGDANPVPDTWKLKLASDAGLLRYNVPQAGRLSFLVRTKQGYLVLIAIPVLMLSLLALMRIWRPAEEEPVKLKEPDFPDLPTPPLPPDGYTPPPELVEAMAAQLPPPSATEAVNV